MSGVTHPTTIRVHLFMTVYNYKYIILNPSYLLEVILVKQQACLRNDDWLWSISSVLNSKSYYLHHWPWNSLHCVNWTMSHVFVLNTLHDFKVKFVDCRFPFSSSSLFETLAKILYQLLCPALIDLWTIFTYFLHFNWVALLQVAGGPAVLTSFESLVCNESCAFVIVSVLLRGFHWYTLHLNLKSIEFMKPMSNNCK